MDFDALLAQLDATVLDLERASVVCCAARQGLSGVLPAHTGGLIDSMAALALQLSVRLDQVRAARQLLEEGGESRLAQAARLLAAAAAREAGLPQAEAPAPERRLALPTRLH